MNTMPFEKCPVCGSDLVEKEVEKVLTWWRQYSSLKVCAEVCLRCGERLYSAGNCKEIRTDQGQAGTPRDRRVSGNRSFLSSGLVFLRQILPKPGFCRLSPSALMATAHRPLVVRLRSWPPPVVRPS